MLGSLANIWRVPELGKRLMFTAALIAAFRLGAFVPLPGISREALAKGLQTGQSAYLTCTDNATTVLFAMFTGGAFNNLSVFSLGIIPYTAATTIVLSMTVAIPRLQELAKEGETGQLKITQYTRYLTLVLASIQAIAMVLFFRSAQAAEVLPGSSPVNIFLVVITLTTGGMLTMWIGELISQRGLGNGITLLITVSILSQAPSAIWPLLKHGNMMNMVVLGFLAVLIVMVVVFVSEGQRRIPLTLPEDQRIRRMRLGWPSYVPLKINMAADSPIIAASALLIFPVVLGQLFAGCNQDSILGRLSTFFSPGTVPYLILYPVLIVMFTYFYTAVKFNAVEHADDLKMSGGYVPGFRPGMPTAVYLNNVLTRITPFGALFLAVVAVVPYLITGVMNLPQSISIGGTSMLIVVGFCLDTARQIESQLLMHDYEGFLRES